MPVAQHSQQLPGIYDLQRAFDVSSPNTSDHRIYDCVHVRHADSHCEACREQIRKSSSRTQRSSPAVESPMLESQPTDYLSLEIRFCSRERRRASHNPSASDVFRTPPSSSPEEPSALLPIYPWRNFERPMRQHVPASQRQSLSKAGASKPALDNRAVRFGKA